MANISAAEKAKRQKEMQEKVKLKNEELELKNIEVESEVLETPVEIKEEVFKSEPEEEKIVVEAILPDVPVAPIPVIKEVVYVNTAASKMDTPCTIIHMRECTPKLPTTFSVNNNTHYFTYFGERKTFRYQDMQNIISRYRALFESGLFCLAEDCEVLINEIPSDVCTIIKDETIFNKMNTLSFDDFKKIVNSFNSNQVVNIAQTYKTRNEKNIPGYDDIDKIKFLNRKSNGLLNCILEKLQNDEEEDWK